MNSMRFDVSMDRFPVLRRRGARVGLVVKRTSTAARVVSWVVRIVSNRAPKPPRMRLSWHAVFWVFSGLVVAFGAASLLWLLLGQPKLSPSRPGALTSSDLFDGIKIALTVVGGIGGVVALVVAYRRQRYSELEHVRAEAAASREVTKLFNERFASAAEQLGSDKAAIRLAGVYALASLADDWLGGRQTCIDVLCAYLRMPYETYEPSAAEFDDRDREVVRAQHEEQQVRHTVIKLIGAHLRSEATVSWQGCDFDFTGATFDGGDFSNAQFIGGAISFARAKFTGTIPTLFIRTKFTGALVSFMNAHFKGGDTNFSDACFSGGAVYFNWALFSGGTVDFRNARFIGGNVTFAGARLTGSVVDFRSAQFTSGHASFGNTRITDGKMRFSDAHFVGSDVYFGRARFGGGDIDFDRTHFSGGKINFSATEFSEDSTVNFRDAEFSSGSSVHFDKAQLIGSVVDFSDAKFSGGVVDFSQVDKYDVSPRFSWTTPPPGVLLPPQSATPQQRTDEPVVVTDPPVPDTHSPGRP